MKNNNLKDILDDIFGNAIQEDDKQSFIYFLKICGAYNEYIKRINIKGIKSYKEIRCENNTYLAFYNIIPNSFIWSNTCDGYRFWNSIHKLHHMILYCKYKKNIIKPNDKIINIMEMENDYLLTRIDYIKWELSISKSKNKLIHMFISKLKDYFNEIGLI